MWPPEHIYRVGVELEGGWLDEPDHRVHGDGSVTVVAPIVGEISSDPMTPVDLLEWMARDDIYPDVGNPSCGMHVHISMNDNNDYVRMMERDFYDAFLVNMEAWGRRMRIRATSPFWPRLRGENNYCARDFIPLQQYRVRGRGGPRYTQLNFCFATHGTVECRLLPLFKDVNVATSAVKNLIVFVEEWITEKHQAEQSRQLAEIIYEDDGAPVEEEYQVAV